MVRGRLRSRRSARATHPRCGHRDEPAVARGARGVPTRRLGHRGNRRRPWHSHRGMRRRAAGDHHLPHRRRLQRRAPSRLRGSGFLYRRGSAAAGLHHQRPGLPSCPRDHRSLRRPGRHGARRAEVRGRSGDALFRGRAAHPASLSLRLTARRGHRPCHLRRYGRRQEPPAESVRRARLP